MKNGGTANLANSFNNMSLNPGNTNNQQPQQQNPFMGNPMMMNPMMNSMMGGYGGMNPWMNMGGQMNQQKPQEAKKE